MRILITNGRLAERHGTELYVRDVATGLLARGHAPLVFSPVLGEVAAEIRRRTIPVVDDLGAIGEPPDVIHGQHHLETMIAATHFPSRPVVSFCHGWLPWEESPPRFPTIRRYVAVDRPCVDRLVEEHAIDRRSVRMIRNFVDLERFQERSPLPPRPARALVFSNFANEQNLVGTVREACSRHGIALEVAGRSAGSGTDRPETLLAGFDVVFAKARCALEALAVGAAVVLCDVAGLGPMVTAAEVDRLRDQNFGVRTLARPITVAGIDEELRRYDPSDATAVRRRIREVAGQGPALDEIIALYEEVVAEHALAPAIDPQSALAAASSYLRWLAGPLKAHDQWRASAARLEAEVARLQATAERDGDRDALAAELAAIHRTATWRLREQLRRSPLVRALVEPVLRWLRP